MEKIKLNWIKVEYKRGYHIDLDKSNVKTDKCYFACYDDGSISFVYVDGYGCILPDGICTPTSLDSFYYDLEDAPSFLAEIPGFVLPSDGE